MTSDLQGAEDAGEDAEEEEEAEEMPGVEGLGLGGPECLG